MQQALSRWERDSESIYKEWIRYLMIVLNGNSESTLTSLKHFHPFFFGNILLGTRQVGARFKKFTRFFIKPSQCYQEADRNWNIFALLLELEI